jgi:aspartate oxidase
MGYSMADPGTGDGVIAAYKVGADVQNAEFFKRQISLRFGPISGKGSWIGVVRDSEGRTIAPPHLARPDRELGDKSIENVDAIDHTWSTGRGPVWMDSRGISEEDEQYMRWGFKSEALLPFLRWLDREKIDVKKTRFEFFGMQPTSNIQARVDKDYRTSIHGLYAIPPGDLSESAVGGFIAGESAAADMKDIKNTDSKNQRSKISKAKACYEEILNREGGQFADWREAQWAVWQTMHCYALPPQRTENTLMAGYHHLLRVRDLAKKTLKASNPHDLYHCLEVLNLMDVAELVLIAVKERRESRGQASRQDYPFTNPLLNKFLVINKRDDCPAIRWEKTRQIS